MGKRQKPIRVAVIGGGCAAVTTAFELTRPEHQGRYEVTIYQLGWRLGGKGASGRGPVDRIEEHGLHVWMGWYENAFRLMRECYAELERDPRTCPIADWQDAFTPASFISVTDRTPDRGWAIWKRTFPPAEGLPGDPSAAANRWTVRHYMLRTIALLRSLLDGLQDRLPGRGRDSHDRAARPGAAPGNVVDALSGLLRYGELATLAGLVHGIGLLETLVGSLPDSTGRSESRGAGLPDLGVQPSEQEPQSIVLGFLDAVATNARRLLEARLEDDLELRRIWQVIDLALATLRGNIRFGLLTDPRGFDAVDEFDCREWLLLNGASRRSVDSGYLNALYDLGFAYEDGDVHKPRVSAAQALRGFMRAFFTYRGAFFWKMQAGMGDVVFAPFYEVLKRRGVRFEFFHRLERVRLSDRTRLRRGETPHVAALEFGVQARIRDDREYEPLIVVKGLPCWPASPDYRQLVDGDRLRREGWDFESFWERRRTDSRTLRVVADFDFVVLGIGVGAVPHVCSDIVERDPRWSEMIHHVKTVPTQAFQLWLREDMGSLGWADSPVTLSGFETPFDTWADMGHLLSRESWLHQPKALAYFCSVLPDSEPPNPLDTTFPARAHQQVRQTAVTFLNQHVGHLWPGAVGRRHGFRWEIVTGPEDATGRGPTGEARFGSQFWTANVNPSDRYTLSLPGSSKYRISPLDGSYDNLTIAGDWTDCGCNSGCVEAAVMSGRLAAHAISQSPPLDDIIGFDHP